MSGNDTHADTIRAALKANGVFRYGEYERSNTRPALAALDALVAEVDRERARADRAEALVERFHEAWWNWNPGADTEALDAAASEAMCLLGTVISLNPAALSAGSGGH